MQQKVLEVIAVHQKFRNLIFRILFLLILVAERGNSILSNMVDEVTGLFVLAATVLEQNLTMQFLEVLAIFFVGVILYFKIFSHVHMFVPP
jgi:hypothetical protein